MCDIPAGYGGCVGEEHGAEDEETDEGRSTCLPVEAEKVRLIISIPKGLIIAPIPQL